MYFHYKGGRGGAYCLIEIAAAELVDVPSLSTTYIGPLMSEVVHNY